MKQFKELREMSTRLVFDNLQSATKAEKLAKRFKLETDAEKSMGNYFLAVTGKYTDIMKWMKQLEMKDIGVSEGRYTSNDGGAFDGLRIAKYLSDKDGNARWSRVPYGTSDSYLKTAMDMLKKDPKRAREILSKPTPRSGSL